MKKWFLSVFMMLAVLVGVQVSQPGVASAEDYYSCTDTSTGYSYYVMTETNSHLKGSDFYVSTREVSADGTYSRVLKWDFGFDEGVCWSECMTDPALTPPERKAVNSPVALSIIRTAYYYKYGTYHPYTL